MGSQTSRKQTTLVPHRTPDLSALLKQASLGRKRDVLVYLRHGGSPEAVAEVDMSAETTITVPLLQAIILRAAEPQLAKVGESLKVLIEAGAEVERAAIGSTNQQRTALMYVAAAPGSSSLRVLLQQGADASLASATDGLTALHIAAAESQDDSCEVLLAAGADVQAEDCGAMTPLLYAARSGKMSTFKLLQQAGASVVHVSKFGNTVLHLAADPNNLSLLEHLLTHAASSEQLNVNSVNKAGCTLLQRQVTLMQYACCYSTTLTHAYRQSADAMHCFQLPVAAFQTLCSCWYSMA
jgi:Ankyrin repeats (3 copies)/Ankyrin repeat